jgi:hypothetical protein
MTDTINLPGLGKTSKTTAYALGGVVVLVGGIAWYRSRGAASSASSSSTPAQADNDPATGYPYGSAEDTAALAQQAQATSGVGLSDFTGGGGTNTSVSTTTGYTSNAAWSQAAEDYLVNTVQSHRRRRGQRAGQVHHRSAAHHRPSQHRGAGHRVRRLPAGQRPVRVSAVLPDRGHPPATPPATLPAPVTGLHVIHVTKSSVSIDLEAVPGAAGYYVNVAAPPARSTTWQRSARARAPTRTAAWRPRRPTPSGCRRSTRTAPVPSPRPQGRRHDLQERAQAGELAHAWVRRWRARCSRSTSSTSARSRRRRPPTRTTRSWKLERKKAGYTSAGPGRRPGRAGP